MKKLSILIPFYNGAPYIRACLESLIRQEDFPRYADCLEIIVLNDGSPDPSDALLDELSRTIPQLTVYSQPNKGIGMSRNQLVQRACGEYLWFIDQDDLAAPQSLRAIFREIEGNAYDLLIMGVEYIDAYRNVLSRFGKEGDYENGLQAIADGFFQNDVWSKVFRRDLLLRYALDFGTYDGADDFYFSFQLYPVCKRIKTIRQTGYRHFLNPVSLSLDDKMETKVKWAEESFRLAQHIRTLILSREADEQAILNRWFSRWMFGFMYSLMRFHYPPGYVADMMKRLRDRQLYPIPNTGHSPKQTLAVTFLNNPWGFRLMRRFILTTGIRR